MPDVPKPNWDVWRLRPTVHLWEAVALSANFDPESVCYLDEKKAQMYWGRSLIRDRLETLSRVMQDTQHCPIEYVRKHGNEYATEIRLTDFAQWATKKIRWTVPRQLKRLGAPRAPPDHHQRPWGDYETKLLGVLAEAVHRWWSDYDPDQPETAPRKREVSAWIEERLKKLGVSNPRTVAAYMTRIIRHDSAPAGRRRKPPDE